MQTDENPSTNWTQGEIVRAVIKFGTTLERIEEKLDDRPSWEDINRLTKAQDDKDKKQDEALKGVQDRAFQLVLLGVGSLLTGASSLVVWLVQR